MKHWIRRTFTLFALVVSVAISYAAPDAPLPVPPKPPVVIAEVPIKVVLPEAGAVMSYPYKFVWESELQPDKYVLKFKRADGTITKYTVPMEQCTPEGICSVKAADTGVLDTAKDGGVIMWRVIATHGDEKTKTDAATFIANTVDTPELVHPANTTQLEVDEELSWEHSSANETYTLIVRDMEGALIIKRPVPTTACELGVCTYDPIPVLAQQTAYTWLVKAKGFNGDKAKSLKQNFTTGSWASSVN